MVIIPIFIERKEEPRYYKNWGEPRAGGVECWKPCIVTLISGAIIEVPRFYDFGYTDENIHLCQNADDSGVWAHLCGTKILKSQILNIVVK